MELAIASAALAAIVGHAAAGPDEACGLLVGSDGRVEAALPAANVAGDPATRFEIDPALLFEVQRSARAGGRALLGWYHSHPNGVAEPSAADAAAAVEDGRLWLIAAAGCVTAWRTAAGGAVHRRFEPLRLVTV